MLNAYRAIQTEAEHPGKKGSMADENQAGLKMGECELIDDLLTPLISILAGILPLGSRNHIIL